VADPRRRNPKDRGGAWFVDSTCIDCDAARQLAPGLIEADAEGLSHFTREPRGPEEERAAWLALLACPTASIGAPRGAVPPEGLYPHEVAPGVFLTGYLSERSFGASSYFVPRPGGNLLVDAPRWSTRLAEALRARGGIAHVLLTHRDDVADFARYAKAFGARTWIHETDRRAAPSATDLLRGEREIAPGVRAIPVPGHTRGSVCFLVDDRFLFSGDSVHWSRELGDLNVSPDFTWFSFEEQTRSLERLARAASFEWVLPGHGGPGRAPPGEMRERLLALVERMRAGQVREAW